MTVVSRRSAYSFTQSWLSAWARILAGVEVDGAQPAILDTVMMSARDDVISRYSEYLEACNQRSWAVLTGFLAEIVLVNGQPRTRSEYVGDIESTISTFPDYRWDLHRAVVEGEWLAVHLHNVGTRAGSFLDAPGDGTQVETDEFDMYRIVDGLIHEVEGTADNARLRETTPHLSR